MKNLLTLDGKVALVTGASSGLGEHFAKVMAQAGAKVVVGARRLDRLQSLVEDIRAEGGAALAVFLDITNENSIYAALDAAEKEFGPVTVLVNNAGVDATKSLFELDKEALDNVIDTNLKGSWMMAMSVIRRLDALALKGSIVNIASVIGLRVALGPGGYASAGGYATSKAGVIQMTKEMALSLVRQGIRVNAICPGHFETEMTAGGDPDYVKSTPAQRAGELDELTGPLLLLASDAGSFITGVALPVDGGHSESPI